MILAIEGFDRYATPAALTTRRGGIAFTLPNGAGNISLTGTTASGVGQSLQLGAAAAAAGPAPMLQGVFDAPAGTLTIGLGIDLSSAGTGAASGQLRLDLMDVDAGTRQASLVLTRGSATIQLLDAGGTLVASTYQPALSAGWVFLEAQLGIGPSPTGTCQVQLDNVPVISASLDSQGGASATWNGFQISAPSIGGTVQSGGYIDDLRVSNTAPGAGIFPTGSFIGPAYALPAFPAANGTLDQWTPSTGGNFQCVEALAGAATSHLAADTSDIATVTDLYRLGQVAAVGDYLLGVELSGAYATTCPHALAIAFEASGGGNLSVLGDASTGGTIDMSGSYAVLPAVTEVNPATGTSWRLSDINTSQFGHALQEDGTSGTVGNSLSSASGSLNAGAGGPPPRPFLNANFTEQTNVAFSFSGAQILAGNADGGVGGTSHFTLASGHLEAGTAPDYQAIMAVCSVGFTWTEDPAATTGALTAHYEVAGTLVSGVADFVVETGVTNPGTSYAFNTSGTIEQTSVEGTIAFGRVAIAGGPTYVDVPLGPPGSVGAWSLQQDAGVMDYAVQINAYSGFVSHAVLCDQFMLSALVPAFNYGGNSGGGGAIMPAIFPTLPGAKYPLRRAIWSTGIATGASGAEVRTAYWTQPLWEWEIAYDYLPNEQANGLTPSDWKELLGFFLAMDGPFQGFLFNDPDDNVVTGQAIGNTDGTTTAWQLVRTFGGTLTGTESIGYVNVNTPFRVYVDGVLQAPTTYSVVTATPKNQLLVFNTVLAGGSAITVDMGYYFYVRFADDEMEMKKFFYKVWSDDKVKIRSLRQA